MRDRTFRGANVIDANLRISERKIRQIVRWEHPGCPLVMGWKTHEHMTFYVRFYRA